MERRRGVRYQMELPLLISHVAGRRVARNERTSNVSSGGIAFLSSRPLEIGCRLEYVVTLKPQPTVELHCLGKVLRVSPHGDLFQIAVSLERYQFLRGPLSGPGLNEKAFSATVGKEKANGNAVGTVVS